MSYRAGIIGVALLSGIVPVAAQDRGTVEFGVFGSLGRFDTTLTLKSGMGVGGRVGVFLSPRVALEFEKGEMRAKRTLGLQDVNVGILAGRLVVTPIKTGSLQAYLGAGAGGSTETNFLHSYDLSGMVGAKLALGSSAALRVDLVSAWLANPEPQNFPNPKAWRSYQHVKAGLSFFRQPFNRVRTVDVTTTGPTVYVQAADSVSPGEIAQLRRQAALYRTLRDSLSNNPPRACVACQAPIKTEKDRVP